MSGLARIQGSHANTGPGSPVDLLRLPDLGRPSERRNGTAIDADRFESGRRTGSRRTHPCALREARSPHPDARRRRALHGDLHAEERRAAVSDPLASHALFVPTLRSGCVPGHARTERLVHRCRLRLRHPGRARCVHVGRRIRGHATARSRQELGSGDRRIHRCVRHDRLARQERRAVQRRRRHVGDQLSGLLCRGGNDRRASVVEGGVAASADRGLVVGRLPPQRCLVPAARVPVPGGVRRAASRTDDGARRSLRRRDARRLRVLRARQRRRTRAPPLERERALLGRPDGAPDVRRLLEGAQPAAPSGPRRAGGHDGRWAVRRREPLRSARDLP